MAAASIRSRSLSRRPLCSSDLALREIDALIAHVAALGGGFLDRHRVALARGEFLDHHGIGALGHHAAGEDARGLTRFHFAFEGMAGGDFADELQFDRRLRHVGCAHRITVHGGDRIGRLRAQRYEVLGEHAAERLVERNRLRRQRVRVGQHAPQGFGDRHQRTIHSVKSSAR